MAATSTDTSPVHRTVLAIDLLEPEAGPIEGGTEGDPTHLIQRQLDCYDGEAVHVAGGAAFAAFDGPVRAIGCARAIARASRAAGLACRAAVHRGELVREGADLAGLAFLVGARMADLADRDEVLVSEAVVPHLDDADVIDRGEHALRGLPGRWHLFAVR